MNPEGKKWLCALLVAFLAFGTYFVRELLAALFLFAVFYIFVALIALCLMIDHTARLRIPWSASLMQSLHLWLLHYRPAGDRRSYYVQGSSIGRKSKSSITSVWGQRSEADGKGDEQWKSNQKRDDVAAPHKYILLRLESRSIEEMRFTT